MLSLPLSRQHCGWQTRKRALKLCSSVCRPSHCWCSRVPLSCPLSLPKILVQSCQLQDLGSLMDSLVSPLFLQTDLADPAALCMCMGVTALQAPHHHWGRPSLTECPGAICFPQQFTTGHAPAFVLASGRCTSSGWWQLRRVTRAAVPDVQQPSAPLLTLGSVTEDPPNATALLPSSPAP
eukprot:GGOE01054642.1.p4 GENE.GGOE01054642.1~~GGOE01054642.1.p4  ORF type:complete len:180 (-),score=6.53 GGOE01054642.1:1180-1719(-)